MDRVLEQMKKEYQKTKDPKILTEIVNRCLDNMAFAIRCKELGYNQIAITVVIEWKN